VESAVPGCHSLPLGTVSTGGKQGVLLLTGECEDHRTTPRLLGTWPWREQPGEAMVEEGMGEAEGSG
jgi:hypothetical protein